MSVSKVGEIASQSGLRHWFGRSKLAVNRLKTQVELRIDRAVQVETKHHNQDEYHHNFDERPGGDGLQNEITVHEYCLGPSQRGPVDC